MIFYVLRVTGHHLYKTLFRYSIATFLKINNLQRIFGIIKS